VTDPKYARVLGKRVKQIDDEPVIKRQTVEVVKE
jgi:hypothetical protein